MNGLEEPFRRLVVALEPWLDQIVVIGGWAHRLYRWHPAAQELSYRPLMTLDADLALPGSLPVREQDIRSLLLAHGFAEEFLGDDRPPATHYYLGGEASGFYVEFLTPLIGGRSDRQGRLKSTKDTGGVASQQLRYIDTLLLHPWLIDFGRNGFAGKIQIANPVSFIAQKVLIHERRDREDRAKDILYIHDTLEVFGSRLSELKNLWTETVAPDLHERQARTVSKASTALFGNVTDSIRRAAQMSDQRGLSPHAIREACQYGFNQVFG